MYFRIVITFSIISRSVPSREPSFRVWNVQTSVYSPLKNAEDVVSSRSRCKSNIQICR